jgi:N-acetylmuramoyl-L-alanine amidase
LANDARADLFVSIHVNASPRGNSQGIETYVYQPRDGDEKGVANLENQAGGGMIGPAPDPASRPSLDGQNRLLARAVQRRVVADARRARADTPDRGVKAAPLLVLTGAQMPAALLEVGFATSAEEARWLARPDYLDRLADGIAQGIMDFVAASPGG